MNGTALTLDERNRISGQQKKKKNIKNLNTAMAILSYQTKKGVVPFRLVWGFMKLRIVRVIF